jgi:hypothetical protein
MKLVKGWKPIRISQEVYNDVEYRRNQIKTDVEVPPGVMLEYAYLLLLKEKNILDGTSYNTERQRFEQIKRIYGLQEEKIY